MPKPSHIELPTGEKIPILYEDRSVLAIDKPRGWMLVPFSWQKTSRNLQAALTSSIAAKDFWARSRNLKYLRFVHRLDADTSGILLLAKSPGSLHTFGALFESRRMEKVYLAVVSGEPNPSEWTCRLKLAPDPNAKMLVCTVEEAVRFGADAVSIHINIGADDEKDMLRDFGYVSREAQSWGIPLLAMMYTRGKKIKNEFDVSVVKHAARVGAELGADIVKVPYTGSPATFREVVEGCFVPVAIAGGEKMETDEDILNMVRGSLDAGGAGVSIGRNAFQHHAPERIVRAISLLVHEDWPVKDALKMLKEKR